MDQVSSESSNQIMGKISLKRKQNYHVTYFTYIHLHTYILYSRCTNYNARGKQLNRNIYIRYNIYFGVKNKSIMFKCFVKKHTKVYIVLFKVE